jgi:hypothetical protein
MIAGMCAMALVLGVLHVGLWLFGLSWDDLFPQPKKPR